MKRLLSSIALSAVVALAGAQTLTNLTTLEDMSTIGGFQPFGISPNGEYICGSAFAGMAFIYDVKAGSTRLFTEDDGSAYLNGAQLLSINNDGYAVGFDDNGGILVNSDGWYEVVETYSEEAKMSICEQIDASGTMIVGAIADEGWVQRACYWKDGVRIMLPCPDSETAGFKVNGSRAIAISEDNSMIVGYLIDRYQFNPMIIWFLQEDGSYEYSPVYEGNYEPRLEYVYDNEGNLQEVVRGNNPFVQFSPAVLTGDGTKVAMYIRENDGNVVPRLKFGIYDVASGSVDVFSDQGEMIGGYGEFIITGLSNDGILVGTAGELNTGTYPFIMNLEDKVAMRLQDYFPTLEGLDVYVENASNGMPFLCTGITPDARYVMGYGVDREYVAGIAFLIDTENGDNSAVDGLQVENAVEGRTRYFTLDGREVNAPVKGITIVRHPDGTTSKTIQ